MTERFFRYKDLKIRYLDACKTGKIVADRRETNRPIVVMLHGWGSKADLFVGAMGFLRTGYHVVAPDMPGFGGSEEPAEPYDLDDYVDFAAAFTRHVLELKQTEVSADSDSMRRDNQTDGDENRSLNPANHSTPEVILLGHSHGGRVIIRLLARQAADEAFGFRVSKAILTDSAGIVPEKTEAQKKRTAEYKRYKAILTKTGLAKIVPGLMDRLQKKYGSADYAAASPVMRQSMVKVVNTDLRAEMPSIKIPVLLIWGDADTATPLSDGQEMERLMPEAGLAVIPGGTHFCFLENPVLYNRILGSFLGL